MKDEVKAEFALHAALTTLLSSAFNLPPSSFILDL
jgi:hypothetical protein